jgi:competence protein ComEA
VAVGRSGAGGGRRRSRRPTSEQLEVARRRVQRLAAGAGRGREGGWVPAAAPVAEDDAPAATGDPGRPAVDRGGPADRLPLALSARVAAPSPRAVVGLTGLALLAVLLAAAYLWLARPQAEPVPTVQRSLGGPGAGTVAAAPATPGGTGHPGPAHATAPPGTGEVVVHVAGAVRRPGVVRLPPGARVVDAVAAAGGPGRTAELASVNLARPVVDGEQLLVLARGQQPPAGAGAVAARPGGAAGVPGGPVGGTSAVVDLNTATVADLDGLPGVGPVLAQRILDWRSRHGRFSSVDELREVSGIGAARFADLKPRVRV